MNLYRPIYHFMPEKNWMNDPNGLAYYKGEYHMFYQYNPNGIEWGTIHWGHAKSKDLIHWEHLPIALYPSKEKGETHCFSGCCVVNNEEPTIFYTSIGEDERNPRIGAQQWMAISKDHMYNWEKYDKNPVLSLDLHDDMDVKEWRDPFLWKEGELWYMVLGGSCNDKGCVFIYKSTDLKEWKFLNVLDEGKEYAWECPNFIKLGDKYVLIYSPYDEVKYSIGTINSDYKFMVEARGIVDNSGKEGFYAPNSLVDNTGRRIMFGWLKETARGKLKVGEWAGVQSVPRILTIEDNTLHMEPAEELQILRKNHKKYENINISESWMPETKGKALEIIAEFNIGDDIKEFAIDILASKDNEEKTSIVYSAENNSLSVDRSKSSASNLTDKSKLGTDFSLKDGETLKLHIFIDYSTVEVFTNYRKCISARVYPIKVDSENIKISVLKGVKLKLKSLDIWEMNSIW